VFILGVYINNHVLTNFSKRALMKRLISSEVLPAALAVTTFRSPASQRIA
jgi:hypothetical protein